MLKAAIVAIFLFVLLIFPPNEVQSSPESDMWVIKWNLANLMSWKRENFSEKFGRDAKNRKKITPRFSPVRKLFNFL